mgnify:CR=1 FL=1
MRDRGGEGVGVEIGKRVEMDMDGDREGERWRDRGGVAGWGLPCTVMIPSLCPRLLEPTHL